MKEVKISETNKDILKQLDAKILEETSKIQHVVTEYNQMITSLRSAKQNLLISIINEKELDRDSAWMLTEDYTLKEVEKEVYENSLNSGKAEEIVNNSTKMAAV